MTESTASTKPTAKVYLKTAGWYVLYVFGSFLIAKFLLIFLFLLLIKILSISVDVASIIGMVFLYAWTFGVPILGAIAKYKEYTGQIKKDE